MQSGMIMNHHEICLCLCVLFARDAVTNGSVSGLSARCAESCTVSE